MESAKKKSFRNIASGFLGQLLSLNFALVVPRLILVNFGSETNGLTSSISQIFAYVALLEAGVGGATLQALYKPVGKQDKSSVSSILAATDRYYKRTGVIYLFAVIGLAIGYPLVIHSDIPYWTVFGVILFNGLGGALNYLFQGKYFLLLQAEGKNYIRTNLTTIIHVVSNIIKIILVYMGCGIVVLQASFFILNVGQMIYVMIYIRKHYQWLDLNVKPDYGAISQRKSVLVHQLSALIFGNTDTIILTVFTTLKTVSVYSLILSLIAHINSILNNVSSGVLFSLGQNFQNNRKRFDELYDTFESIYFALMAFCLIMFYIFLNPFLAIYTRGVNDIRYVDDYLPLLFTLSYFLTWARVPSIYVINNCAGHFKLTQTRSIIESVINIVVSLVAVWFYGIYGVLAGTIIALFYRTNDMIIYSAKKILHRSLWESYRKLIFHTIWIAIGCVIGTNLLPHILSYYALAGWLMVYAIACGLGTCIIMCILDPSIVNKSISFIKLILIKKKRT